MRIEGAARRIIAAATAWPDVEAMPGMRGELALMADGQEIGHLHGDAAAHFFFPKPVWAKLHAEGRITHHPVFPAARGPAARRIESEADIADVIALLRLNYERLAAKRAAKAG